LRRRRPSGTDTKDTKEPGPKAAGKWLTASVTDDIAAVIGVTVTIVIDFVHALEYLWKQPGRSSSPAIPTPRPGSQTAPPASSKARPPPSPPASAAALELTPGGPHPFE
jgi:hypothetical protein